MRTFSNVRVNFSHGSILDFDKMVHDVRRSYQIGYAGLFEVEKGVSLFIQKDVRATTRMALGKINRIFLDHAAIVDVCSFTMCEGKNIESYGTFREEHCKSYGRNTWSTSTRREIYLHINALGEEDTSHITKQHLEDFVGTEDTVVDLFKSLPFNFKENHNKRAWASFRRHQRQQVRFWDEQERLQNPDHESLCEKFKINANFSDCEESQEEEDESDVVKELQPMVEPPTYDPDSDSEGNHAKKRQASRIFCLTNAPHHAKDEFFRHFEKLILENPHNTNIRASTKSGFLQYFDGDSWVKTVKEDFFSVVTTTRVKKLKEVVSRLHGQLSDFVGSQISVMVRELARVHASTTFTAWEDHSDTTLDEILAVENMRARLKAVEAKIGKRIVFVGNVTKHNNVVRNSTLDTLNNLRL